MKIDKIKIFLILLTLSYIYCAVNMFAARYYRLLEKERIIFLGLRGIDSLVAMNYLNLESATERADFYEKFWQGQDDKRKEFEDRAEYAFREFGKYAPLNEDRIVVYVKYGPPFKRDIITPEKRIGIKSKEVVNPAEIWTYKAQGLIIDFVRFARAYEFIARSEFGERIKIPYLKEIAVDTSINSRETRPLDFNIALGRFRQKKNLTRLEIYINMELKDTMDLLFSRTVKIYDKTDSLVSEKRNILKPQDGTGGIFYDEINLWLTPDRYRLEIELVDMKNNMAGKKILWTDLIEYQDDVKEISDIIAAKLIDDGFTNEKFHKPVGRVIPFTNNQVPVYTPFYFYSEVYNLGTKNGMYQIRTTYEVYNIAKMRKEIVDVMIKDWIDAGDVAYLGAAYHPMDLSPGNYIVVIRVKDLISGKERSTFTDFELLRTE